MLKNGKFGFINKEGQEVIPCIYNSALNFSEGLAAVLIGNKWGFINLKNEVVIDFQYQKTTLGFKENLCAVVNDNKMGFIDNEGTNTIKFDYEGTSLDYEYQIEFNEGLCPVKLITTQKYIYIDKTGEQVGKQFDIAMGINEGLGVVVENNKYGFVNTQGQIQLPIIYNYAREFKDQVSVINN